MRKNSALRKEKFPVAELEGLELVHHVVEMCEEVKAKDISVLNISKLSCVADYFIIASGRSDRQVQGIANRIIDSLHERGMEPYSIEGLETGQWVIVDFGDVVAHIFYEPVREHYDLEGSWARAERV